MSWKMKQMLRKALPYLGIAAALWFTVSLYNNGIFRRGVGPAFSRTMRSVPMLGSHFRPYKRSHSYSYSKKHYGKRKHHHRRGKKARRRHRR